MAGEQRRELPQPFGLAGEIDPVAAVHLQVPEPRRDQQAPGVEDQRVGGHAHLRPDLEHEAVAHHDVGRFDAVVTDDGAAQDGDAHVPTPAASSVSRPSPQRWPARRAAPSAPTGSPPGTRRTR